ncbi:hypothetical protein MTO96_022035 [Rhipicephalus appendiculatus]
MERGLRARRHTDGAPAGGRSDNTPPGSTTDLPGSPEFAGAAHPGRSHSRSAEGRPTARLLFATAISDAERRTEREVQGRIVHPPAQGRTAVQGIRVGVGVKCRTTDCSETASRHDPSTLLPAGLWQAISGREKRTDRILAEFFWPGMHRDVENFVASCDICQKTPAAGQRGKYPSKGGQIHELPGTPMGFTPAGVRGSVLSIKGSENVGADYLSRV